VPYFQIGDDPSNTRKQGYAMTVVPGLDKSYKLSLNGNAIPSGWIVEFSDTIFGNRCSPDQINLQVVGKTCPATLTSQHDRQFIWADTNGNYLKVPGRGACSGFPDKPRVDCTRVPKIYLDENCPQCSGINCGQNGYCDCGTKNCICKSGFSGANCQNDICSYAKCAAGKGACTMTYLGGDLPATMGQCACKPGFFGDQCDADPCAKVKCGPHGTCASVSATDAVCVCSADWDGPVCDHFCGNNTKYPKCDPPCVLGIRYYANSDYSGANVDIENTGTKEECGEICLSKANCNGFSWLGACYLKSVGKLNPQNNVWAGVRCTNSTNNFPVLSYEYQ